MSSASTPIVVNLPCRISRNYFSRQINIMENCELFYVTEDYESKTKQLQFIIGTFSTTQDLPAQPHTRQIGTESVCVNRTCVTDKSLSTASMNDEQVLERKQVTSCMFEWKPRTRKDVLSLCFAAGSLGVKIKRIPQQTTICLMLILEFEWSPGMQ